ncbi:MAG: haloacid dehalogenase-like hydrolase [Nitrospirae bacterium]|nr:haloacid dehalogenase-like hydrolase [Nitrospirota bacterium]
MRLVLFDIDGTLVSTDGAGRLAVTRAFQDVTGIPDGFAGVRMAGKTDPQIVREGLEANALPGTDGLRSRILDRYLSLLPETLARAERPRLLPGVERVLDDLARRPGVAIGLLTGNIEDGARVKLSFFGIWERFALGAYGSDDEERKNLVPFAVERAARRHGRRPSASDVWLVGDTPNDIAAARAHGARVLAVASGPHTLEELKSHAPDAAVRSLDEPEGLARLIDSPPS